MHMHQKIRSELTFSFCMLILFTQSGDLGHHVPVDASGCLRILLTWCWCLHALVCVHVDIVVSFLFLLSFPHSGKVQVTGAEFLCHQADIFPGRYHGSVPHRPVAPGLPRTLPLLYERQSYTGTCRSQETPLSSAPGKGCFEFLLQIYIYIYINWCSFLNNFPVLLLYKLNFRLFHPCF